jgi:hypothetical protein
VQTTMTARLVAAEARPYGAFKTADGREQPGGNTYRLYLVERFNAPPIEVRCTRGDYDQAVGLGSGALVSVTASIGARVDQSGRSYVELRLVELAPAQVPATPLRVPEPVASNGRK